MSMAAYAPTQQLVCGVNSSLEALKTGKNQNCRKFRVVDGKCVRPSAHGTFVIKRHSSVYIGYALRSVGTLCHYLQTQRKMISKYVLTYMFANISYRTSYQKVTSLSSDGEFVVVAGTKDVSE